MDDSPKDIGSQLKKRREDLGYSLEEVSERIRIRKVHLEHIEANRFSDLPGKVYVTGFVNVYSRYLGLDGQEILKSLPDLTAPEEIKVGEVAALEKFDKQFNVRAEKYGWGVFFIVLVILIGLGLAIFFIADFLPDENKTEKKRSDVNQAVVTPPKVTVEQYNSVKVTPTTTVAETEPVDQVKTPASPTTETIEEEPLLAEKTSSIKLLPSIAPGGSSLRMLALAEGSLIIDVDERNPHEYQLHDGLDLTWKVTDQAKIKLSDAGIARFWLDARELEIAQQNSFLLQANSEEE